MANSGRGKVHSNGGENTDPRPLNVVDGTSAGEELLGTDGDDQLNGRSGEDTLKAGAGDDVLDGGAGNDTLIGGTGDDVYFVHSNDTIVELANDGTDLVVSHFSFTLPANVENLTVFHSATAIGNELDNFIRGSNFADDIYGLAGSDSLQGRDGNDTIDGGDGSDNITGGGGRDILTGGAGRDMFIYYEGDSEPGHNRYDTITDFSQQEGDIINLRHIDANRGMDGDQEFTFVDSDAFSGHAGELRVEHSGGNTWIQGDTDGDGGADLAILLVGHVDLTVADFVI